MCCASFFIKKITSVKKKKTKNKSGEVKIDEKKKNIWKNNLSVGLSRSCRGCILGPSRIILGEAYTLCSEQGYLIRLDACFGGTSFFISVDFYLENFFLF